MKIIVSLREPIDRMVSAYKNKVADGTVKRHLDEQLYHGTLDKRKDSEFKKYKVPSIRELAIRVNATLKARGLLDLLWRHIKMSRLTEGFPPYPCECVFLFFSIGMS